MSTKTEEPVRQTRVITRYIRIAPRKIRLVIDTIRHKPLATAFSTLQGLNKKGARIVEKTLKSAQASAKGKGFEESRLVVSEIRADGGPVFKRFMSRSMGRADQILKRTSHLTIILREGERTFVPPAAPETGKKAKGEKPKKEKRAGSKKQAAAAQAG